MSDWNKYHRWSRVLTDVYKMKNNLSVLCDDRWYNVGELGFGLGIYQDVTYALILRYVLKIIYLS